MHSLLTQACKLLENNETICLAVVIHQEGSTPRGAGSRMLVSKNGLVVGTIGGGLVEGMVLEECQKILKNEQINSQASGQANEQVSSQAKILDLNLSGTIAAQSDMICGGNLRVLIEAITPAKLDFFKALIRIMQKDWVLITDITCKNELQYSAVTTEETIGAKLPTLILNKARELILNRIEKTELLFLEGREFFIEHFTPPLRMIIVGGGHVSRPTSQIADLAGFQTIVLDDRPEFSNAERFPWAESVLTIPNFEDCFIKLNPDNYTYIVIVTRGHLHDATVLQQALATKAGYIGMIGSKRKRKDVYDTLRSQGVSEELIQPVRCPIGLDINAETPEEIAVSIVAQCIAHRRS
ncbi:XdhC family aldehyde oxidoreductase maturation factor [Desulfovibrio litoralis]|uniref:Xanthine dehydrogenase accessory factor n=1 Tax=Desulfovibrio litoralis DSM 11393 TaxID=1121455 RepID=A0A1M7TJ55_9BACT|nr:XdhC/CoxI family protein [Desulfovibrio litoralis]SHN70755.1 xanthine dehydrogenase accessory factor [Desulfovibrio litoralis DSM 11393]